MNVANVILCWVFIFGHLGAPAMGPTGAGFSAFVSTWIGLVVMLVYVLLHRSDFHPVRWSNIARGLTWDMVKLSIPAALATIVMMFGFALFTKIVNVLDAGIARGRQRRGDDEHHPDHDAHVHGVHRVRHVDGDAREPIARPQRAGRGRALRAGRACGSASSSSASSACARGSLFREQVIRIFAATPGVQHAMHEPMMLVGVVTPLISVALILSEALFGAGSTKFVAVAQFLLVFGVLVPGAWIVGLKLHVGLNGIWIAACLYAVLAASVMAAKFRAGGWKRIVL